MIQLLTRIEVLEVESMGKKIQLLEGVQADKRVLRMGGRRWRKRKQAL